MILFSGSLNRKLRNEFIRHSANRHIMVRPLKYFFALSILISLTLNSCTTQKQITYLQNLEDSTRVDFYPYNRPEYRLQKQDILYVKIFTMNEDVNNTLSPGGASSSQQAMQMEGAGGYLLGYSMNDSGYISLPTIGDIYVYEKTLADATRTIEEKVSEKLKNTTVVVKLITYRITILGEVNNPGSLIHYGKQLTIMEALGMAGDITDYGDRSSVLVVRPMNEGSETFRVNLKDKNLLASEAYFLLPNDLVIVEPRRAKLIDTNSNTLSTFFTLVTMTLLIVNFAIAPR